MIEKNVKDKLRRIIDKYEQSGEVFWSYWPVQTGLGKHGVPDCLVCLHGQLIAIETKVSGKQPTTRQWHEIREIEKAGGISLVVDQHNLSDVVVIFNAVISNHVDEAREYSDLSKQRYAGVQLSRR